MSRTDLDPATLARSLRRMAGDGSVEWVMEPMQASVLLDVADFLDEVAELRGQAKARPVIVSDGGTDGATGYCRCGACEQPIDPWDRYCRHCGTEVAR